MASFPAMDTGAGRWAEATAALRARDPALGALIGAVGPCTLARRRTAGGYFAALARSILYQQLAGAAAAAIHGRFLALFGGRPTPEAVLATADEALRAAGLSAAKAASVKDLAAKVLDGTVRLAGLGRLDDEEILGRLACVRGIGRWTGEMFLIFQLNRPDVWPVGDLGVRAGFARTHLLPEPPRPAELAALGDRYRPYRTVAAWYCWRAVDAAPPGAVGPVTNRTGAGAKW
jgi:DNA-3-methyladenine glycosylase II